MLVENNVETDTYTSWRKGVLVFDDQPLYEILPILEKAKVGGFVLPFANPRHQHEWRVLQKFPLADDQIIVAGVIDDLTGFVEHPEVVADRLENVARAVGDSRRGSG